MKIKKDDVDRLSRTAGRAAEWLTDGGKGDNAVDDFGKVQDLLKRAKPHKRDSSALTIRHSVIRKVQKRWLNGLMEFYRHAAVPVDQIHGDLQVAQDLIIDVTEDYQFIEWFVIDSLNKDNLDEDDHREADEAFAEEERQYRERQKKRRHE